MNKKGFTLVEVLAVVIIMSLIIVLALPKINNSLNSKKSDIDNTTNNLILNASKLYVADYKDNFSKTNGNIYCLPLTTLTDKKYLENPVKNITDDKDITNIKSVKISYDNAFKYEIVDKKNCRVNIEESETPPDYETNYSIGDQVIYNGITFYAIENSDESKDTVTLLKAEALTVDEVNTYGAGHVNNNTYSSSYRKTAYNSNGYGGMQYYSSSTCGYPTVGGSFVMSGCKTAYDTSEIKYVVDNWSNAKLKQSDLKEDSLGYKVRLLTIDELTNNLGYDLSQTVNNKVSPSTNGETPTWVYNTNYWYWTMSSYNNSSLYMWYVTSDGKLYYNDVNGANGVVRPVITIYKSAL